MIKCQICGIERNCKLDKHIKKEHGITLKEYQELYGNYISEEFLKKLSVIRLNQFTPDVLQKKSDSAKKFYQNGGQVWSKGLTKETNDIVRSIGEQNSKTLTGRTKENYDYLRKHSEWAKKNSHFIKYNEDRKNIPEINRKWREATSLWYVNNLDKQRHPNRNYQTGYYINEHGEFYYQSSWEKEFMEFLDSVANIKWTNKHGIRIPYKFDGINRFYIPDFYITYNDTFIIIELKGWIRDDTQYKIQAAIETFGDKFKIFYNINDAKEFIYEFCQNTKNTKI